MGRQIRQITDPRAPFASIEAALAAGEEHLRALGWSFVGIAAEEQPGGYFVRIAGTVAPKHGRRGPRNHRKPQTAEIGRIPRGGQA